MNQGAINLPPFTVEHFTNTEAFIKNSQFEPLTGNERMKYLLDSLRESVYAIKNYPGFNDLVALCNIEELELLIGSEYLHKDKIDSIVNFLKS